MAAACGREELERRWVFKKEAKEEKEPEDGGEMIGEGQKV